MMVGVMEVIVFVLLFVLEEGDKVFILVFVYLGY